MKLVITVWLLMLGSLTACHKPSYTYFSKSSTPVMERKIVSPKSVSISANETLVASVKPTDTEVSPMDVSPTSVSTSVPEVSSESAMPDSKTFQEKSSLQTIIYQKSVHKNSLITKRVLKKIGKLQAKTDPIPKTLRTEPFSLISFASALLAMLDILILKTDVLGIIGVFGGIILGIIGLIRIRRGRATFNGRGFAIVGILLAYFLTIVMFILSIGELFGWG